MSTLILPEYPFPSPERPFVLQPDALWTQEVLSISWVKLA